MSLSAPLTGVLRRYADTTRQAPASRRKPGRPKKRTPEYLRVLLQTHREVQAWYVASHGGPASSDRELYTAFFAAQFTFRGERAARASTPEFQRALKTLRNELSVARRLHRERPENPAISGTPLSIQSEA